LCGIAVLKNHPNLTLNAPAAQRQDAIMGHAPDDRASIHHRRIGDDRLQAPPLPRQRIAGKSQAAPDADTAADSKTLWAFTHHRLLPPPRRPGKPPHRIAWFA
jgi:hypothetical protein